MLGFGVAARQSIGYFFSDVEIYCVLLIFLTEIKDGNSHKDAKLISLIEREMKPSTAQTVGRAIELMKLVASSRSRHLRLIDIAEMAKLDKSTAHRLLQRLVQERMLARDEGQRGYRLGPLLYELGLAALPESNVREIAMPALQQVASTTGDMTFLVVRSGFDTVCLDRIAGNFAIQTMTQGVGDRHPLGVGAGGLAILASLSDDEVDAILHTLGPQLPRYRLSEKSLRKRIQETRKRGHAIDEANAALDVTAIGRAIHDKTGCPMAAVFVASIRSRMSPARLSEVDRRLATCVKTVETSLNTPARRKTG
jgi:DNA-binding IclR family transcriptional regulator